MENFLSNNEWARNSSFDHFWRHYAICEQWRKQHFAAVNEVNSRLLQTGQNVQEDVEEPEVTERLSRCEIRSETGEIEVEIEEISDEMRDFFAKTREHRKQLAEKRAAEKNQKPWEGENQEEYVNVGQITVRGRIEHSAKHRDANAEFAEKREYARKMYGKEAAVKILALESQLEMQFEAEYARNPQLWPNIPFRF